ncbi:MAG TPA: GNAT family N-acetyltransferase [Pyrinomonadaceae bacterium]|nr:GNAT family N-acetyltransferase [Pyrinomonadaceae bacterium]
MLTARGYEARDDLRRLCRFVVKSGTSTLHAGDIQLMLSDPSFDAREEVRLWEEDGQLVGFAFVRPACCEFVFEVKPCARRPEVETQLMEWAMQRMRRVAAERGERRLFFAATREDDDERISLLERCGFTRDEHHCVYMHYPLDADIPPAKLPEGFTVRHLAGALELRAYVAAHCNAFWMDNLTERWRRSVLLVPDYVPELDLIAVAPDGVMAACCLCWLEQSSDDPQSAKRGYVQTLGTRPKFQNEGLGRAVFLEALRRLQAHGARVAVGQVEALNTQILRVCERIGVRPLHNIYRYGWNADV